MMRTALLQSNLPIAFWGAALLYAVDCHNATPHSSVQFECLQFLHNCRRPDVRWHKPFGCRATVFRGKQLAEHHKLTARGEAGVFIGLGTQHGRKAWLVYSPKQNRIYASRNVTFDETLFPLRDQDQRFYCVMQHQLLDRMRNDMDIDYDIGQDIRHLPNLPEPTWTADDISYADTDHAGRLDREPAGVLNTEPAGVLDQADSEIEDDTEHLIVTDEPPYEDVPAHDPSTANNYKRPKPARKRPRTGSGGAGAFDPDAWKQCENTAISDATDRDLADYVVGISLRLKLNSDYWPDDDGQWTVEYVDSTTIGSSTKVTCLLVDGPVKDYVWTCTDIDVSAVRGQDYSIRRAISENHPHARKCKDLLKAAQPTHRAHVARPSKQKTTWMQFKSKQSLAYITLTAVRTVGRTLHACVGDTRAIPGKGVPLEPRNQREARKRHDADKWLAAEQVELKTCFDMGTFEIIDRPDGCNPIQSMFTYKLKMGDSGQIIKYKVLLCARGDLQLPSEYNETYAPTSRFTAIRVLIAIATQMNLRLMQWDIKGAYMTADLDQELYLEMPPGYELPPNKVARMRKSLYGLRQAGASFYKHLSSWLKNYGFQPI
eukprot:2129584-Rhodomonas_salina.2